MKIDHVSFPLQIIVDKLLRETMIIVIRLYQRFLSPHKGYVCSFATVHSAPSCSCAAITTLSEMPMGDAVPAMRQRFNKCAEAYRLASIDSRFQVRQGRVFLDDLELGVCPDGPKDLP